MHSNFALMILAPTNQHNTIWTTNREKLFLFMVFETLYTISLHFLFFKSILSKHFFVVSLFIPPSKSVNVFAVHVLCVLHKHAEFINFFGRNTPIILQARIDLLTLSSPKRFVVVIIADLVNSDHLIFGTHSLISTTTHPASS